MPSGVWAEARAELLAERERVSRLLGAEQRRAGTAAFDVLPAIRGVVREWNQLPAARIRDALAELISAVVVWRADADGEKVHRARVFPVWEPPWEGPGTAGIPA